MLVALKSALCCGRAVNMMANVRHIITLGPAYNDLGYYEHIQQQFLFLRKKTKTFMINV